jgi:hypothetical protein
LTMEAPFTDIRAHLEFLGFEVYETINAEKVFKGLTAKHGRRSNLFMQAYMGGVLIMAYFGCNPEANDDLPGKLELCNNLNSKASVARATVPPERGGDIAVEAWFPYTYSKSDFGVFIDNFENDITAGFKADAKLGARILK